MSEAKRLNEEELKYLKTQEPIGGDLEDLWGHIAWQEGEIARLKYVPGLHECKKCGFVQVSTNLHVNTGGFSSDSSPKDCANGCGPMWKVSREDSYKTLSERLDSVATGAQNLRSENAELRVEIARLEAEKEGILEGSQEWEESFHQAKALEKAAIKKWQRLKGERDLLKKRVENLRRGILKMECDCAYEGVFRYYRCEFLAADDELAKE